MKQTLFTLSFLLVTLGATAQYRPRPDAFPPVAEQLDAKAVQMADSVEAMANWDRYPTYETYLAMMRLWAETYPTLCHIDTIGRSIENRLILSIYIEPQTDDDLYRPEFFYSSTIHGDEVTGYVMMLRLIDTLLSSYGTSPEITNLINSTRISINPLANPDGTYHRGNHTVQGSQRYNADNVDLNRNYPDPFAPTKEALAQENEAMIAYVSAHHFRLSANLHGGSEVMNYPWDCFTSRQNPHPAADWWQEVCHRFVDTARSISANHFNDVREADNGVIAGGDWYVIHGGRQDYINYYHDCLELTMEISVQKTLSSSRLPEYWHFLAPSLINYIGEIHSLPGDTVDTVDTGDTVAIDVAALGRRDMEIYPNPTTGIVTVRAENGGWGAASATLIDARGREVSQFPISSPKAPITLDISNLQKGIYFLCIGGKTAKIAKL